MVGIDQEEICLNASDFWHGVVQFRFLAWTRTIASRDYYKSSEATSDVVDQSSESYKLESVHIPAKFYIPLTQRPVSKVWFHTSESIQSPVIDFYCNTVSS